MRLSDAMSIDEPANDARMSIDTPGRMAGDMDVVMQEAGSGTTPLRVPIPDESGAVPISGRKPDVFAMTPREASPVSFASDVEPRRKRPSEEGLDGQSRRRTDNAENIDFSHQSVSTFSSSTGFTTHRSMAELTVPKEPRWAEVRKKNIPSTQRVAQDSVEQGRNELKASLERNRLGFRAALTGSQRARSPRSMTALTEPRAPNLHTSSRSVSRDRSMTRCTSRERSVSVSRRAKQAADEPRSHTPRMTSHTASQQFSSSLRGEASVESARPAAWKPNLTAPKSPKFSHRARARSRSCSTESTRGKSEVRKPSSDLRKVAPAPAPAPAKTKTLTTPRSPNLSQRSRARSRSKSESARDRSQSQGSSRARSTSRNNRTVASLAGPAFKPQLATVPLTQPVAFNLSTSRRTRSKSRDAGARSQSRKRSPSARASPRGAPASVQARGFRRRSPSPRLQTKPAQPSAVTAPKDLTTPEPFTLRSELRAHRRAKTAMETREAELREKAEKEKQSMGYFAKTNRRALGDSTNRQIV